MNIFRDFLPLLQDYGALLLLSVLLFVFYLLFMFGKHSYRFQRCYLLAIPVFCLLQLSASLVKAHYEAGQGAEVFTMARSECDSFLAVHPDAVVLDETSAPKGEHSDEILSKETSSVGLSATSDSLTITPDMILSFLYVAVPTVSVVLLLLVLFPFCRLRMKMRRLVSCDGILRESWVKTPFSFGSAIFLPIGRTPAEESLFIRHEQAHIASRHYVDVWIIELLTRLLWFNPVLWLVRKTLRDLHEFEADRIVLEQGVDVHTYQCLLVSEASEDCMIIANGFNNSFIRRRIREMKCGQRNGIGRLGKFFIAAWVIALAGAVSVYALPEKRPIIVQVQEEVIVGVDSTHVWSELVDTALAKTSPQLSMATIVKYATHFKSDTLSLAKVGSDLPDGMYSQRLFIRYPSDSREEADAMAERILKSVQNLLNNELQGSAAPGNSKENDNAMAERVLKSVQIRLNEDAGTDYVPPTHDHNGWRYVTSLPLHDPNNQRMLSIRHQENETFITFAKLISSDNELVRFGGPDSYIVDVNTGIHYKARRSIPEYAWHYFYVKDMKDKTVDITVVFPRIPDTAQRIAFYQVTSHLESGVQMNVERYLEE